MFRVGLAQMTPILGDVQANLALHRQWIERARQQSVDLLMFPELSLTGYHLRDLVPDVALKADSTALTELSRAAGDMSLVVGFVEESPSFRFHVSASYLEGGRTLHTHRKAYLPTYGMFDEERYLDAGDRVRVFQSRFGPCALLICEDMWHPSVPYLTANEGAFFLLCIANSPARGLSGSSVDAAQVYERLCRVYAQFFQVWVIFVNRVGFEEGVNFWGGSMVVNPMGDVTAQAPLMDEHLLVAEVDQAEIRRARVFAPLLASERLDLTLRELGRIVESAGNESDERP